MPWNSGSLSVLRESEVRNVERTHVRSRFLRDENTRAACGAFRSPCGEIFLGEALFFVGRAVMQFHRADERQTKRAILI